MAFARSLHEHVLHSIEYTIRRFGCVLVAKYLDLFRYTYEYQKDNFVGTHFVKVDLHLGNAACPCAGHAGFTAPATHALHCPLQYQVTLDAVTVDSDIQPFVTSAYNSLLVTNALHLFITCYLDCRLTSSIQSLFIISSQPSQWCTETMTT